IRSCMILPPKRQITTECRTAQRPSRPMETYSSATLRIMAEISLELFRTMRYTNEIPVREGDRRMKLTTVKEIYREREKYLDKEITVGGWVRSVRDSKTFGFIVLHDGTFFETLQIVYHDSMDNFAEISKLNVGAAIIVKGTLVATPQAKQPFEIQAAEITVEGASAPDYP